MGKESAVTYRVRHPALKMALAVALALAHASAAALGLGQIEVKSRIGQPLLAEIPIISSDPAELEELRAGLASPETFARIGLQPPSGIVADLQFVPALDAAGRPVIRVTSVQPVSEPMLTFLVEVDWGQGRLVREYSVLVDTPRTVSAPVQPPIDAPVISQPNLIERPPEPATPVVATPAPGTPPLAADVAEPPRPDNAIAIATPLPLPPPPVAAVPGATTANEYGPVKAGESLSRIAGRLEVASGFTLDQSMIALLRANPDAFIDGNINQLKQGAVLRVPPSSDIGGLEARQATALVRGQVRQWRQARGTASQPAANAGSAPAANRATAPRPVTRRDGGARLEIVPPGASLATRAGTQSGISAGGEGQMLRQELQQTKESLAARDAELRELKGRVAELEKLQADQQQLLSLKDTELAAVQQRLAASNTQPASVDTPVPAQTQTASAHPTPPADAVPPSSLPWMLGGVGVLALVLLLGGWLLRRRSASTPRFRVPPTSTTSSLADAFAPVPPRTAAPATWADAPMPSAPIPVADAAEASVQKADPLTVQQAEASQPVGPPVPVPDSAEVSAASWDRPDRPPLPTGRAEAPAPAWHAGAGKSKAAADAPAAISAIETSLGERLELAQAYLDLGDRDSARQLLGEVVVDGDHAARQQAARMLRELE